MITSRMPITSKAIQLRKYVVDRVVQYHQRICTSVQKVNYLALNQLVMD